MKHFTPVEKLDHVLHHLSKEEKSVTINEFHSKVGLSYQETNEIFHKLKLDGNARESKEGIGPYFFSIFYITFDGRYFLQAGGYNSKALQDANEALLIQAEIDRRHTLDEHLKNAASRLNRLTLWLAIGTAVLALMEIIKFACEISHAQINS